MRAFTLAFALLGSLQLISGAHVDFSKPIDTQFTIELNDNGIKSTQYLQTTPTQQELIQEYSTKVQQWIPTISSFKVTQLNPTETLIRAFGHKFNTDTSQMEFVSMEVRFERFPEKFTVQINKKYFGDSIPTKFENEFQSSFEQNFNIPRDTRANFPEQNGQQFTVEVINNGIKSTQVYSSSQTPTWFDLIEEYSTKAQQEIPNLTSFKTIKLTPTQTQITATGNRFNWEEGQTEQITMEIRLEQFPQWFQVTIETTEQLETEWPQKSTPERFTKSISSKPNQFNEQFTIEIDNNGEKSTRYLPGFSSMWSGLPVQIQQQLIQEYTKLIQQEFSTLISMSVNQLTPTNTQIKASGTTFSDEHDHEEKSFTEVWVQCFYQFCQVNIQNEETEFPTVQQSRTNEPETHKSWNNIPERNTRSNQPKPTYTQFQIELNDNGQKSTQFLQHLPTLQELIQEFSRKVQQEVPNVNFFKVTQLNPTETQIIAFGQKFNTDTSQFEWVSMEVRIDSLPQKFSVEIFNKETTFPTPTKFQEESLPETFNTMKRFLPETVNFELPETKKQQFPIETNNNGVKSTEFVYETPTQQELVQEYVTKVLLETPDLTSFKVNQVSPTKTEIVAIRETTTTTKASHFFTLEERITVECSESKCYIEMNSDNRPVFRKGKMLSSETNNKYQFTIETTNNGIKSTEFVQELPSQQELVQDYVTKVWLETPDLTSFKVNQVSPTKTQILTFYKNPFGTTSWNEVLIECSTRECQVHIQSQGENQKTLHESSWPISHEEVFSMDQ